MNVALVTGGSTPLVAVRRLTPVRFTLDPENATRPAASLVRAPPPVSVPVPTRLKETSCPATALLNASLTLTCTAGAIATPATTLFGATANVSAAAAAGDTVNAGLVTGGSAPLEAVSCLLPTRFRLTAGNVARPFASLVTEPPPVSVPVPTSASDTSPPGTELPNASVSLSCSAGAIATPATTSLGPAVNVSAAAAAGDTVNATLVTVGSSIPLEALSCLLPTRLTLSPGKLAIPDASLVTEVMPESVPVPTRTSDTVLAGTPLPNASLSLTCTLGAIAAPATALAGGTVNATAATPAGETVNEVLVTVGTTPLVAVSCLLPARFRLSPEKVAMPAESLTTAAPPVSVPVPTRASDTDCPASVLPNASLTWTWTPGTMRRPAIVLLGATANVSAAAAAGVTVNAALVAGATAPLAAVSCLLPARFTLRAGNVAMPAALLVTTPPPVSVPVPTSESDTGCPGTALPNASLTRTLGAGAIDAPATTLLGPTV